MPNIYSWVISGLNCHVEHEGYSNVVFMIYWRRQATDGVHTVDIYGAQPVAYDSKYPFTPYDQLEKLQVEKWLMDAIGVERLAVIDAELERQINDAKAPPVISPDLPWG